MADALQEVTDKQAITEVIYRYCRGLDRMDADGARSVWHADGTADYGSMFEGTGAQFVEWVWGVHAAMARHSHQITNIIIEVDGDRAVSEAYVTVALRTRAKAEAERAVEIEARGRYLDRWSRRDGRWAIDHRKFVQDLQRTHDADPLEPDEGQSRRDRSDPSYEILR